MLSSHPGVELIAACGDGDELEGLVARERPDAVITDIHISAVGAEDGVGLAARLRDRDPELGLVILSQSVEPDHAVQLMSSGTSGRAYLLKDRIEDASELVEVVRTVTTGGSAIDPLVVEALIAARAYESRSRLRELTPRELQILAQIAEGKSNSAIAASLVLTKRAVEKHVNAIFAKLDLPDPAHVSRRVKAALLFLAEEEERHLFEH